MGIFKKRDPAGSQPQTRTPPFVPESPDYVGFSSQVPSSSSLQAPPPPRRVPIPRQVTVDHIAPPPIQPDEIQVFSAQIDDLTHCLGNNSLFDVLIGDIDRNRLTQMSMILADKGDYPTMARVMELTEKLDRLIAQRLEETHEQQRKSFRSEHQAPARSLDNILAEADKILERTDYTETEKADMRTRIPLFDQYFFSFQNEPIEQVLLLSEKIDEMRKRFRRLHSSTPTAEQAHSIASSGYRTPPAQPALPDDPEEPWVLFAPEPDRASVEDHGGIVIETSPAVGERRQRTPEVSVEDFPLTPTEVTRTVPPEATGLLSTTFGSRQTDITSDIPEMTALSSLVSGLREPTFPDADTDGDLQSVGEGPTLPGRPRSSFVQSSNFHPALRSMSAFFEDHDVAVEADAMADKINNRLSREILVAWKRIMESTQRKQEDFTLILNTTRARKCIADWKVATRVNPYYEAKLHATVAHTLRAWRSRALFASRKTQEVETSARRKLLGPILVAWKEHALNVQNAVFSFQRRREENSLKRFCHGWLLAVRDEKMQLFIHRDFMLVASLIREWRFHVNRDKELSLLQDRLEARLQYGSLTHSFHAWKTRSVTLKRVEMMQVRASRRMRSEVVRAWFQQLTHAKASRARVGAIRQADESFRKWKAERHVMQEMDSNSRLPVSPPTEYYFIHDEPTSPFTKESAMDIKRATEDIIVQTQTFLSQRHMVNPSPDRTSPPPFRWPTPPPVSVDSRDDFFLTFERKWALEEAKWRL